MPKLTSVSVSLKLPFLGDINGTWEPDEVEQRAAWEMYVELVTRTSLAELQPGEGSLHEALSSLSLAFARSFEYTILGGSIASCTPCVIFLLCMLTCHLSCRTT